jgi:hypothetical protein
MQRFIKGVLELALRLTSTALVLSSRMSTRGWTHSARANRHPLLLPAGELTPRWPHEGVVPSHRHDEVVRLRRFGRCDDFVRRQPSGRPIGIIVAHGAR